MDTPKRQSIYGSGFVHLENMTRVNASYLVAFVHHVARLSFTASPKIHHITKPYRL
jgi:hypothetical protein